MSFWLELKRRNVYKVGAAYALVALSIIAVQSDIAAGFGLSRSFQRWVIVLLAAGFPLVALLAWAYELTPTGLKRTSQVPRSESTTHVTGRRLNYVLAGLVGGAVLSLGSVWLYARDPDARWVEATLPAIEHHIELGKFEEAFALLSEGERRAPQHPALAELWPQASRIYSINSDPPGARVMRGAYGARDDEWMPIGITPLEVRLPVGMSQLRLGLDDHRPVLTVAGVPSVGGAARDELVQQVTVRLDPEDVLPENMVRVTGLLELPDGPTLSSFFLGRHEVTNAEYKAFIDAGGYENFDYWRYPIIENGREIPWDEAVERIFVDDLGFAGPGTWQVGDFPEGEGDFPVRGVSWYEAQAYTEWADAVLPTVYHWRVAISRLSLDGSSRIPASNMDVSGSAGRAVAVGQFDAPNRFGAYDISGNVREWLFNAVGELRYIAGGAWNDPTWLADEPEIVAPINRDETNGFRIARTYEADEIRRLAHDIVPPAEPVDHFLPQTFSDETFEINREFYSYDPFDLGAEVTNEIDDKYWVRQQVMITTAYGERMPLYVFLPRNGEPPYRIILHISGAGAWRTPSFDQYAFYLDLIVRAGYAVAMPVYKGSFDRIDEIGISFQAWETQEAVERIRQIIQDTMVSLDYLETRDDIDSSGFGFFGFSIGSVFSPIILANEPRFEVAVLASGGFSYLNDRFRSVIDPGLYLDRVTQPVLMINGEFDELFPLETHIKAFHERLGSEDKRLHVEPGRGHTLSRESVFRETIDWLKPRF